MDEILTLSTEFARLLALLRRERDGDPTAQCERARLLLQSGAAENRRAAFVRVRDLARGAYTVAQTDAMYLLGVCYENGFGVARSCQSAIRWYKHAVGNISRQDIIQNPDPFAERAQRRLEELTRGRDFDEALDEILFDDTSPEAVDCVTESAEAGDVEAQEHLTELYRLGARDVEADKEEALHWAQKAAENGSVKAMEYVADAHYFGRGVAQNVALGLSWYEQVSRAGSDVAPGDIARHLEAQKRYKEAAAWYRLYAERRIRSRDRRLEWEGDGDARKAARTPPTYDAKPRGAGDSYTNGCLYYDPQRTSAAAGTPAGGALLLFATRRENRGLSVEGLSEAVAAHGEPWAVGRFFHRMSYRDDGCVFDDNSLCAAFPAASAEQAVRAAEQLCRRFRQKAALLKLCESGEMYLVRRQNEEKERAEWN